MAAARQGRTCPGPFARGRTGPHLDRPRALPPLQPAQRAAVLRGRTARQGSRTDRVHGRHRYRLRRAYRTTGRPARHTQAHPTGPGAPPRRAGYQGPPERTGGLRAPEPPPADPHAKEAALIEFMGDIDTGSGVHIEPQAVPPGTHKRIRPVLERLRDAPDTNASLSELAALARMSRYQLIRTFRTATGMTPHAW